MKLLFLLYYIIDKPFYSQYVVRNFLNPENLHSPRSLLNYFRFPPPITDTRDGSVLSSLAVNAKKFAHRKSSVRYFVLWTCQPKHGFESYLTFWTFFSTKNLWSGYNLNAALLYLIFFREDKRGVTIWVCLTIWDVNISRILSVNKVIGPFKEQLFSVIRRF